MQKLTINTNRLTIRNLKTSDLNDFYFYRCNPEVTKYQGFDVFNLEQSLLFINEQKDKNFGRLGEWVQYAIENKATNKIIGDCSIKLDQYDARIAEIGITISHIEQQKGFATEVLCAILDFLLEIVDFHRVTETVDAQNVASIQLLTKLGFKKEGHFIENIFFKGKWGSEMQFAMLKRDYHELRNKNLN